MSHDAEEVLCDKVKDNSFSIQVDGSIDFTDKSCIVVQGGSERMSGFQATVTPRRVEA
jgi:hypothetical protein